MLLSNLIEVEAEVPTGEVVASSAMTPVQQEYSLDCHLECVQVRTTITGGGSWFHRMIVRGKNEYLFTFMFVLIV
jgi:hypothetical protein